MNKLLMMSAAAILGATSSAWAQEPSKVSMIQFMNSGGGSYCDGMSFYKSPYHGIKIELGQHLLTGCSEANTEVAGNAGKGSVNMVENWQGTPSVIYSISKPVKSGGTYTITDCNSSGSCYLVNAGTYKLGYSGKAHGGPSAVANVMQKIAAKKAAARQ
jgi:hypothetical protein